MSELYKSVIASAVQKTAEDSHRANAVAAALEVIAARATGASGSVNLAYEFEKLSTYADQIQEAMKVK